MYQKLNWKIIFRSIYFICGYLLVQRDLFLLKIFLLSLVVWISERADSKDKTKNSRFLDLKILGYKKFKVLKIYLAYWGFAKCLFWYTVV